MIAVNLRRKKYINNKKNTETGKMQTEQPVEIYKKNNRTNSGLCIQEQTNQWKEAQVHDVSQNWITISRTYENVVKTIHVQMDL